MDPPSFHSIGRDRSGISSTEMLVNQQKGCGFFQNRILMKVAGVPPQNGVMLRYNIKSDAQFHIYF